MSVWSRSVSMGGDLVSARVQNPLPCKIICSLFCILGYCDCRGGTLTRKEPFTGRDCPLEGYMSRDTQGLILVPI